MMNSSTIDVSQGPENVHIIIACCILQELHDTEADLGLLQHPRWSFL